MSKTSARSSSRATRNAALLAVIAAALSACAAKPKAESTTRASAVGERPAGSYGPDTVLALDPVEPSSDPEPAPAVTVAARPEPAAPSPQGPPDWWFSGERREGESVSVCAAGFGPDLPGARDAAIVAARQRLLLLAPSEASSAEPGRVERLSVMPLPSAKATPARYVGYAMISAGGD